MVKFETWLNQFMVGKSKSMESLVLSYTRYCGCTKEHSAKQIAKAIRKGNLKASEGLITKVK